MYAAKLSWHTFYFCSTFFLKESYTSRITPLNVFTATIPISISTIVYCIYQFTLSIQD